MLKALAQYLMERKDEFYRVSAWTGATKGDSWIDIDGGIGTLFAYASRGRREFPDETFYVDGGPEALSKGGTFVGRHICVPMEGVAVQINAFNFPVLGHAGEARDVVPRRRAEHREAGHGDELPHRGGARSRWSSRGSCPRARSSSSAAARATCSITSTCQDAVAFTGSAATGLMLKSGKAMIENSVRFNQEADSLNFSMLGPDAAPGTEEFDLFIKEVARR